MKSTRKKADGRPAVDDAQHRRAPTGRFPHVPLDPPPRPWATVLCVAPCALAVAYGVWDLATGTDWIASASTMLAGALGALAICAKRRSDHSTIAWAILARLVAILPRSTPLLFDLDVVVATFLAGRGRSGSGNDDNALDLFVMIDRDDDGERRAAVYCRQQVKRLWPVVFGLCGKDDGVSGESPRRTAFAEVPQAVFAARGIPPSPVRVFVCRRPSGAVHAGPRDRHRGGRALVGPLSALPPRP
ncbi:hypothetical protein pdul_cds_131 [Pandoravirus dulcis]|uniref:Uncharacterized protein n=1 Tax=Pandoravirus dulcis TaxID=1349409 RepID=S4VP66_9VIRU|nr:hypothetical protein pdul_cds_131 [Pandoravirus dulcis]AGO82047.1 hypothetical protein pdul_cds_131 [Pandoravirus dulcis]